MGRKKIFKNYFPRMRVHHLVIYMFDKNGRLYMSEEQLKKCISAHDGGYASFAYILHDMDTYDAEAVYQHSEKNRKTFIERLRILRDAKGLERDETTESGFVHHPFRYGAILQCRREILTLFIFRDVFISTKQSFPIAI